MESQRIHSRFKETPEERSNRLQKEHEQYIASIATMRSLPQLRSTIAGAGGKTNENARIAEEREHLRLKRMREDAEKVERERIEEEQHNKKIAALKEKQEKKRLKRLKKKKARTERTGMGSSDEITDEDTD